MTYEPIAYWRERGETYQSTFIPGRYVAQERALFELLDGIEFETVLDVGCGFGRIGAGIRSSAYTGIDVSSTMLAQARARLPGAELVETSLGDFAPATKYDLVIAVEVLMHIPPDDVGRAIRKLDRLSARHIVTLDWTTPVARPAAHNFIHDYPALLGTGPFGRTRVVHTTPVGLQTIHHVDKR